MRHYLVVANQTLGGKELLGAIRDRMAQDSAEFWVVVPATPLSHLANDIGSLSNVFPIGAAVVQPTVADLHDQSVATAETNLAAELERLRGIGATVDGAVADEDPLVAIEEAVATRQFDEIILSTLPPGISRWLSLDLPHRVRRRIDLPLTVITVAE